MKEYKNTEIKMTDRVYALIYGASGVGKSFFLGTVPKLVVINTDMGEKVWRSKAFLAKYPNAEFTILDIEKQGYEGWMEVDKAIKYVEDNHAQREWKNLGLDSFTEVVDMALTYAMTTNPDKKKWTGRPSQPDYGEATRLLKEFVLRLRALPLSVWVIGHEDTEKDETTGRITTHPMAFGKFARRLGKYFDAYLYMDAYDVGGQTKRRFLTENVGITQAKSNLSLPRQIEDPDYAKLVALITEHISAVPTQAPVKEAAQSPDMRASTLETPQKPATEPPPAVNPVRPMPRLGERTKGAYGTSLDKR